MSGTTSRWNALHDGEAVMPELASPAVCDNEQCGHADCAAWREANGSPCEICGEPVVTGQKFRAELEVHVTAIHNRWMRSPKGTKKCRQKSQ